MIAALGLVARHRRRAVPRADGADRGCSRTCRSPSSRRWTPSFGGLRALLDGIFDDKVFVVSFVSNVLVAALIVYLGDQLGVGSQLSTGVVVVLGIRIFSNAAAIRRHLLRA